MDKDNRSQNLIEYLKKKDKLIIEGSEPSQDVSYQWISMNQELEIIEQGIPLLQFSELVQKRNLEMEYRLLRRLTESQHHNEKLKEFHPDINKLNRYSNIIPYSHSEIQVNKESKTDNCNASYTYINANSVNTCVGDEGYMIATQGPLPKTFFNFYKMVIEKNVSQIMMLCQLEDSNGSQCDQYWPKGNDAMIIPNIHNNQQNISVNILSEREIEKGLIERILQVNFNQNGQLLTSCVTAQIHWLQWPDHGAPQQQHYNIIEFLLNNTIDNYLNDNTRPALIHCSAGIGRTGTMLSLFDLTLSIHKQLGLVQQQLLTLDKLRITVFGTVRRLREQRWGLLTSDSQYKFIYNFITSFSKKIIANVKI